jgi:hypothetical protein
MNYKQGEQHHQIYLGGTSAYDHDHNGQFREHRKPVMLKNRQLQGKPNTCEVFTDNLLEFLLVFLANFSPSTSLDLGIILSFSSWETHQAWWGDWEVGIFYAVSANKIQTAYGLYEGNKKKIRNKDSNL